MNFATYVDFRTAVLKFIDGDDVNSGSINQSTLDLMIAAGEQAVYYGMTGAQGEQLPPLRVAEMEAPLSLTSAGNLAPLPTDALELVRVQIGTAMPLDYVAEEAILRLISAQAGSGSARQYTRQGNNLLFFPVVSDATTIGGRYYQKAPDISTGTLSAAFNKYPDVWLYAALSSAAPFIGEDQRIAIWKMEYRGRLLAANRNDRVSRQSGSRLTIRAR